MASGGVFLDELWDNGLKKDTRVEIIETELQKVVNDFPMHLKQAASDVNVFGERNVGGGIFFAGHGG